MQKGINRYLHTQCTTKANKPRRPIPALWPSRVSVNIVMHTKLLYTNLQRTQ